MSITQPITIYNVFDFQQAVTVLKTELGNATGKPYKDASGALITPQKRFPRFIVVPELQQQFYKAMNLAKADQPDYNQATSLLQVATTDLLRKQMGYFIGSYGHFTKVIADMKSAGYTSDLIAPCQKSLANVKKLIDQKLTATAETLGMAAKLDAEMEAAVNEADKLFDERTHKKTLQVVQELEEMLAS